jgi:ABC-type nickel/cobalt efflux system permease component RcnA
MAAIPGWVYVIIGVVMIASSQLIKETDGTKPLRLFLYIGIVFIIIGLGKLFYHGALKRKQQDAELAMKAAHVMPSANPQAHHMPAAEQQYQAHKAMHQADFNPQQPHQVHKAHDPQHLSIITCPACSTRHYSYANFCMRCGTRMKR